MIPSRPQTNQAPLVASTRQGLNVTTMTKPSVDDSKNTLVIGLSSSSSSSDDNNNTKRVVLDDDDDNALQRRMQTHFSQFGALWTGLWASEEQQKRPTTTTSASTTTTQPTTTTTTTTEYYYIHDCTAAAEDCLCQQPRSFLPPELLETASSSRKDDSDNEPNESLSGSDNDLSDDDDDEPKESDSEQLSDDDDDDDEPKESDSEQLSDDDDDDDSSGGSTIIAFDVSFEPSSSGGGGGDHDDEDVYALQPDTLAGTGPNNSSSSSVVPTPVAKNEEESVDNDLVHPMAASEPAGMVHSPEETDAFDHEEEVPSVYQGPASSNSVNKHQAQTCQSASLSVVAHQPLRSEEDTMKSNDDDHELIKEDGGGDNDDSLMQDDDKSDASYSNQAVPGTIVVLQPLAVSPTSPASRLGKVPSFHGEDESMDNCYSLPEQPQGKEKHLSSDPQQPAHMQLAKNGGHVDEWIVDDSSGDEDSSQPQTNTAPTQITQSKTAPPVIDLVSSSDEENAVPCRKNIMKSASQNDPLQPTLGSYRRNSFTSADKSKASEKPDAPSSQLLSSSTLHPSTIGSYRRQTRSSSYPSNSSMGKRQNHAAQRLSLSSSSDGSSSSQEVEWDGASETKESNDKDDDDDGVKDLIQQTQRIFVVDDDEDEYDREEEDFFSDGDSLDSIKLYKQQRSATPKQQQPVLSKAAFRRAREDISQQVFAELDRKVFDHQLRDSTSVVWSNKLRTTAGVTRLLQRTTHHGSSTRENHHRSAVIELSTKVLDDTQRLRSTLLHEMCHAAMWLVDQVSKPPHGACFKKWAALAQRRVPEYPAVTTTHNYAITFKFAWACDNCGAVIKRHSRSIDVRRQACGSCSGGGNLVEIQVPGDDSTEYTARKKAPPTAYNLFVQEHSAVVRKTLEQQQHGTTVAQSQVLKECGRLWRKQKQKS